MLLAKLHGIIAQIEANETAQETNRKLSMTDVTNVKELRTELSTNT